MEKGKAEVQLYSSGPAEADEGVKGRRAISKIGKKSDALRGKEIRTRTDSEMGWEGNGCRFAVVKRIYQLNNETRSNVV